jgi:uncharacterized protein (DUF1800 family)
VPDTLLSRRNLFATGAGVAMTGALAELAHEPLFAASRPDRPLVDWQAAAPAQGSGLPPPDPIVYLVNRITFGLRRSDLDRARGLGFDGFVEEQLNPEQIDDSEVDAVLAADFPTLFMRPSRLLTLDKKLVTGALVGATLFRALYSRRQLYELMVDFWTNHFNIYQYEKEDYWLKTVDDREVIRRHALGKFGDLLSASAASPAMLVYLDNAHNTKAGPNENYAREMLELHTLGVNGGYTQQDVQEVARAFTGWTVLGNGANAGRFTFNPATHDNGARNVLGQQIPAGLGVGHGQRVLEITASHPSTAVHVATKLCVRFVSDTPPQSLVDAAVATFNSTQGDIREVMRTILTSDEFRNAADQKLRRPFEVVGAGMRALDAQVNGDGLASLAGVLVLMGQLPFNWIPPNGYPDANAAWVNTNGMLNRWNFGLALGAFALKGVTPAPRGLVPGQSAAQLVDELTARLLARPLLPAHRQLLVRFMAGDFPNRAPLPTQQVTTNLPGLVALILDSPYFQWR